jgi:hypothetical protein
VAGVFFLVAVFFAAFFAGMIDLFINSHQNAASGKCGDPFNNLRRKFIFGYGEAADLTL